MSTPTGTVTIQGTVQTPEGTVLLGPSGLGFPLTSTVAGYQSGVLNTGPTSFAPPAGCQGVIITVPALTQYTLKGVNSWSAQILLVPLVGANTYMVLFGPSSGVVGVSVTAAGVDTTPTMLLFI